jgi:LPXTG-motif cell wall-anchored protein
MTITRMPRRLLGTSAILAGTVIAVVGLVPTLAAAQGDAGPQGHLVVQKTVEGVTSATFGFNVTCDDGFERTFRLDANSSKEFDGIWEDSVCVVTETDAGGATSTTVTPDDGTVVIRDAGDAGPATVSFVNLFVAATTTTSTSTTTTTTAPTLAAVTTTTTLPVAVLGVTLAAPPEAPAELPRTGNSTAPTLVTVGLGLTALGIALRRKAARSGAILR